MLAGDSLTWVQHVLTQIQISSQLSLCTCCLGKNVLWDHEVTQRARSSVYLVKKSNNRKENYDFGF